MIDGTPVLSGTGSRSLEAAPQNVRDLAEARVRALLDATDPRAIILSGLSEGFDKVLALAALQLGRRLWCAIPSTGYADYYWRRKSLTGQDMTPLFNQIVADSWKVTYVAEDVYSTRALYIGGVHVNFLRNQFMVDHGDAFAVWDPSTPGTADCLRRIQTAQKPYKILSEGT